MMQTTKDLANLIDQDVDSLIAKLSPFEWDENHISYALVESLRARLINTESIIEATDLYHQENGQSYSRFYINVQIYKVTGHPENRYGDIAIIVEELDLARTGTGFYEAKAEGVSGTYPAFNMRQFRRLCTANPNLALLLYQRALESIADDECSLKNRIDGPSLSRSRVRVIGANIARNYSRIEFIPDLPQSFGRHFVGRYLTGRDLDYARDPLAAVQRWVKFTRRASPIIVNVKISRSPILQSQVPVMALPHVELVPFVSGISSKTESTQPAVPVIEKKT